VDRIWSRIAWRIWNFFGSSVGRACISSGGARPSRLDLLREVLWGSHGGGYEDYFWDGEVIQSAPFGATCFPHLHGARSYSFPILFSDVTAIYGNNPEQYSSHLSHLFHCRLNQQLEFCKLNSLYSYNSFFFSSNVSTFPPPPSSVNFLIYFSFFIIISSSTTFLSSSDFQGQFSRLFQRRPYLHEVYEYVLSHDE
jgi:hypothetical protein